MFNKIYQVVFDATGITREEIQSISRQQHHVKARSLFVVISRKIGFSYPHIATELKRDHTSIIHLYQSKKGLPYVIDFLENNLKTINKEKINSVDKYFESKKIKFLNQTTAKRSYRHVYEKYGGKCMVCSFDEIVEVHHIKPRYLGGGDELENLALLCPNHHAMADRRMIQIKRKIRTYTQRFRLSTGLIVVIVFIYIKLIHIGDNGATYYLRVYTKHFYGIIKSDEES